MPNINYNRTLNVKVIAENVVTCFFGGQGVVNLLSSVVQPRWCFYECCTGFVFIWRF